MNFIAEEKKSLFGMNPASHIALSYVLLVLFNLKLFFSHVEDLGLRFSWPSYFLRVLSLSLYLAVISS